MRRELLESTAPIPDVSYDEEQTDTAATPVERPVEHLPPQNDRRPRQRVAKAHRARGPPPTEIDDLDKFIYGAENIGRVINLDARKTFYALEAAFDQTATIEADRLACPGRCRADRAAPAAQRTDQHPLKRRRQTCVKQASAAELNTP